MHGEITWPAGKRPGRDKVYRHQPGERGIASLVRLSERSIQRVGILPADRMNDRAEAPTSKGKPSNQSDLLGEVEGKNLRMKMLDHKPHGLGVYGNHLRFR